MLDLSLPFISQQCNPLLQSLTLIKWLQILSPRFPTELPSKTFLQLYNVGIDFTETTTVIVLDKKN